jgi:hypothetical protein
MVSTGQMKTPWLCRWQTNLLVALSFNQTRLQQKVQEHHPKTSKTTTLF